MGRLKVLIILVLIFSCTTSEKKPDWISGSSSNYPSSRYLLGVGRAQETSNPAYDQTLADERARAELARQIKSRIKSELSARAEEELNRLGADELRRFSQHISSAIFSSADVELLGVEIKERYYDAKEGVYYTLAVLDRERTCELLSEKISSNLAEIKGLLELEQNQEKENPLLALSYLIKARKKLEQTIGLNAQRFAVCAKKTELGYSIAELIIKEYHLRKDIRIMVLAFEENPYLPKSRVLENHFLSLLSGYGFSVKSAPSRLRIIPPEKIQDLITTKKLELAEPAGYFLLGSFKLVDLGKTKIGSYDYHFFMIGGGVTLFDLATGEVLLSIYEPQVSSSKAGKTDPAQAVLKALDLAGEFFRQQLVLELAEKYQLMRLGQ